MKEKLFFVAFSIAIMCLTSCGNKPTIIDSIKDSETSLSSIPSSEPTKSSSSENSISSSYASSSSASSIETHEHTFSNEWTYNGTKHWHASTCGHNVKIDEEEHILDAVITRATFEADGYTTHTCRICGYSYTDSQTDKLNHSYSNDWTYDQNKHWHVCRDEGYENLIIGEASHVFDTIVTVPTYDAEGYTTYTCKICGYSYTDGRTNKLTHNYSNDWTYDQNKHWHVCTDEGFESLVKGEEDHIWNDVVTAPTGNSGGYTTHTCSVCGYSYRDLETDPLKYTIKWEDWDGTILETDNDVPYGTTPTYDGTTPTRNKDAQYTYTFSGWSPTIETATADIVYTAQYSTTTNQYTITWKDEDGSVLDTETYDYGSTPSYKGTDPIKQSTDFVYYTFSGWSPNISVVTDDAIYSATYVEKNYAIELNTLNWQDYLSFSFVLDDYQFVTIDGQRFIDSYSFHYSITPKQEEHIFLNTMLKFEYKTRGTTTMTCYVSDSGTGSSNSAGESGRGDYGAKTLQELKDYISNTIEYKQVSGTVLVDKTQKYSTLTVNTNNSKYGSVSGGGIYKYGSTYTIEAAPNENCTFEGWYLGNTFVSSNKVLSEKMSYKDLTLTAKFTTPTYTINYNLDGGTNSLNNPTSYTYYDSITLEDATKTGYQFNGWFDGSGNQVTSIVALTGELVLTAHWNEGNTYSITLDPNGGSVSNTLIDVQYDHSYSLSTPTRLGYTFDGWFDGSTKISDNGTWKFTSDKTFTAHWTAINYSINYTLNGGTNDSSNPSSYTVEDSIALLEPTYQFNTFDGWYLNDELITTIAAGTTGDLTLNAKWYQTDEQKAEEEWNKAHGIIPVLSKDGKTMTYGLYPQTYVNDSSLISALNELTTPESNGWYLYNNEYYAKLSAKPYSSNYVFNDGTKIVSGTTYWFKCEPITWKVLSSDNGEYYLLSSVLLDAHRYAASSNNYKNSEIRSWLNGDFYNTAFALDNTYVYATIVDNSAATTDKYNNKYVCANTGDKVFLPSWKDYTTVNYGFPAETSDSNARYCKTTDWARARGASYSSGYYGEYWTRSPSSNYSNVTWYVSGGMLSDYDYFKVSSTDYCVRPGIYIKIAIVL